MKNFLERLNDEVLVCDGAMGTMLMKEGMPKGVCPEMWGIENAKILTQIYRSYRCGFRYNYYQYLWC